MPSNRNMDALYPAFRLKVEAVLEDMHVYAQAHMPVGYRWIIVEGYRTREYQKELYAKGRTAPGSVVTFRDGYKRRSNHQSSLAVDIAPVKGGLVDWHVQGQHWDYLGHVARSHGLEWGGDYAKIVDRPHCQWPESDTALYNAARTWQKGVGLT